MNIIKRTYGYLIFAITLLIASPATAALNEGVVPEPDLVYFNWSCETPELVQYLNDLKDNEDAAIKLIKEGKCFYTEGQVITSVLRFVKTYRHADGWTASIIEVNGPGNRKHYIVIEDDRTF